MAVTNATNPNDPLVYIMEQMKNQDQKHDRTLSKLDEIGSDLNKVSKRVEVVESKVDRLEKEFDQRVIEHINAASSGGSMGVDRDEQLRFRFEEARRTVLIAPISTSEPKEAEGQAINIMHNILKIQLD